MDAIRPRPAAVPHRARRLLHASRRRCPAGTRASDIRAIRVQAFERPPAEGAAPAAPNPVTLTRINKVFMLDERYLPGPSILKWEGSQTLRAGGEPFEVKVR